MKLNLFIKKKLSFSLIDMGLMARDVNIGMLNGLVH